MTDAKHEAPAEGAGEIEGLKRRIKCLEKLAGEQSLRVMQQATRAKDAENELVALRARSSAPEAREEALGNLLAVIHGDGGHRAMEVGTKQAALEAEKIVAGLFAAPSADKLRFSPTHRHLGRGSTYEVIGEARLQQAGQFGPVEGDSITVYRGEDGQLWCRAQSEFEDGRFEALSTPDALKGDK